MTKNELKYYHKLRQKKFRDSENKFLIEGQHLVEECIKSDRFSDNLETVFVRNDFNRKDLKRLGIEKKNIELISLDEKSFKILTDTTTPQGIIGVVSKPEADVKKNTSRIGSLSVALDTINDPGNLGTIIRTCYCFGVDELLISSNSVDLYNPKVLRSTQGAIFNLNIRPEIELEYQLEICRAEGYKIILTDLDSQKYLNDHKFIPGERYILVLGNEAGGISKNILANKNYERLKIKMFTGCESLNISVSAGIVLNHVRNSLSS
ncbi:MAG: RNA methyltransferase [Ignavibacteria bacterium]